MQMINVLIIEAHTDAGGAKNEIMPVEVSGDIELKEVQQHSASQEEITTLSQPLIYSTCMYMRIARWCCQLCNQ